MIDVNSDNVSMNSGITCDYTKGLAQIVVALATVQSPETTASVILYDSDEYNRR